MRNRDAQNKADLSLISVVNEHLSQLSRLSVFDASEGRLTVASASLRSLLVDDLLGRAWKASQIGGPMTFKTWCIVSTQGDDAVAYCGGGDIIPGHSLSICWNARLEQRTLSLGDFRQRARIQIGNTKISTIELVQYVANTKGGAHFDPKSTHKPVFELLRRLEADELDGLPFQINGRNMLHHEILSIGQAVAKSPEVARLSAWQSPAT
jgi:hypothetical protein